MESDGPGGRGACSLRPGPPPCIASTMKPELSPPAPIRKAGNPSQGRVHQAGDAPLGDTPVSAMASARGSRAMATGSVEVAAGTRTSPASAGHQRVVGDRVRLDRSVRAARRTRPWPRPAPAAAAHASTGPARAGRSRGATRRSATREQARAGRGDLPLARVASHSWILSCKAGVGPRQASIEIAVAARAASNKRWKPSHSRCGSCEAIRCVPLISANPSLAASCTGGRPAARIASRRA